MLPKNNWIHGSIFILLVVLIHTEVESALVVLRNQKFPTQCLHALNSDSDNTEMNLVNCDPNDKNQVFRVDTSIDKSYGTITFLNGKCLGVRGDGKVNGQRVIPFTCVGAANQNWIIHKGSYSNPLGFEFKQQAGGLCVTAEAGGAYIDIYGCYDQSHQYWIIEELVFLLENKGNSGKCLSQNGPDGGLILAACDMYSPQQKFFSPTDGAAAGSYYITFAAKVQCLTASPIQRNGDKVIISSCDLSPGQMWKDIDRKLGKVGYFHIRAYSGNCLTPENGGQYVDQYTCLDYPTTQHQFFKRTFLPLSIDPPGETPSTVTCTKDQCCASGGKCDISKSSDIYAGCCPGSYCTEHGLKCILQCGAANKPCIKGFCCENFKCTNNVCIPPPANTATCKKENLVCSTGIFASLTLPCCPGLSCKGERSDMRSAFCAPGTCVTNGAQCQPNKPNEPNVCCALHRCMPYRNVYACRPIAMPKCGRRNEKINGCKVGDGSEGFKCCGGQCDFKGNINQNTITTGSSNKVVKDYACNCSPKEHSCITDSDCCNSECGPDYLCYK